MLCLHSRDPETHFVCNKLSLDGHGYTCFAAARSLHGAAIDLVYYFPHDAVLHCHQQLCSTNPSARMLVKICSIFWRWQTALAESQGELFGQERCNFVNFGCWP